MIDAIRLAAQAEDCIKRYVDNGGIGNMLELRFALELLMAKTARAIEKHAGNDEAALACRRTLDRINTVMAADDKIESLGTLRVPIYGPKGQLL